MSVEQVKSTFLEAKNRLKAQGKTVKRDISSQALEQRNLITRGLSTLTPTRPLEPKGTLSGGRPETRHEAVRRLHGEIAEAEQKAKADIDTQVKAGIVELDKQETEAIATEKARQAELARQAEQQRNELVKSQIATAGVNVDSQIAEMKASGDIPTNAKIQNVSVSDGKLQVEYTTPVSTSEAFNQFRDLKAQGKIPDNAQFTGVSKDSFGNTQINYNVYQSQAASSMGTPQYATDLETGKIYEVSNPRQPVEVQFSIVKTETTGDKKPALTVDYFKEVVVPEYVKAMTGSYSQEELKQMYENEHTWEGQLAIISNIFGIKGELPEWAYRLFGVKNVQYHANSNMYYYLVDGEAPSQSNASKAAQIVKTARQIMKTVQPGTREAGYLTGKDFDEFVRLRVLTPDLTPDQYKSLKILESVRSSKILTVRNTPIEVNLKPTISKPIGKAPTVSRTIDTSDIDAARMDRYLNYPQPSTTKQLSEAELAKISKGREDIWAKIQSDINKAKAKELVEQAQKIYDETNKAVQEIVSNIKYGKVSNTQLQNLVKTNTVIPALAINNEAIISAVKTASQRTQQLVVENLAKADPSIASAVSFGDAVGAKGALSTYVKAKGMTETITDALAKYAAKLDTKTLTKAETKAKLETLAETKLNAIADTQLRAKTKAMVEPLLKPLTRTITEVTAKTTAKQVTRTPSKQITKRTTTSRKVPSKKIIKIKIPDVDGDYEIELTEKQWRSKIAWVQGKLAIGRGGELKPVYKLIWFPYRKQDGVTTLKPIKGINYGSNFAKAASTVRLTGDMPKTVKRDMGIMDLTFKRTGTRVPKLSYRSDKRQQTRTTGYSGSPSIGRIKGK